MVVDTAPRSQPIVISTPNATSSMRINNDVLHYDIHKLRFLCVEPVLPDSRYNTRTPSTGLPRLSGRLPPGRRGAKTVPPHHTDSPVGLMWPVLATH